MDLLNNSFVFCMLILPCKLPNLVSLRGQKSKNMRYLRIQGRMHIFEKMSQSALNHVSILQKYRTQKMLQTPQTIIDLQNDSNLIVAKQWKIIISVPMSYISLWEWQKVVPQGPFGRIKLYFEHEKRPAGAFWADKIVFGAGKASRRGLLDGGVVPQATSWPPRFSNRGGGPPVRSAIVYHFLVMDLIWIVLNI